MTISKELIVERELTTLEETIAKWKQDFEHKQVEINSGIKWVDRLLKQQEDQPWLKEPSCVTVKQFLW